MQAVGSRRSLGASHAFPQQGRREKLETESADAPPDNHYKPQKDVGRGKSACGLLVSMLTWQFMLWNPSHKIKRQQSFLILYNGSIFGKHIVEHNFINQKGWAECNHVCLISQYFEPTGCEKKAKISWYKCWVIMGVLVQFVLKEG